jgi:hypothetical protein
VTSGACTVASDATCFHSPNYPSNYGNNQQCTITVTAHAQVTLSVTAFTTESGYDFLTVNGVRYDGTSGPEGVQVAAGSTIFFTTDYSVVRSGFEICGASPESLPELTCMSVHGCMWRGGRELRWVRGAWCCIESSLFGPFS